MAVRYNGLIHDWGLLNPIATVPEVRTAITQVATELKRRLNSGS
jgi:acetyl esterase